MMSACSWNPRKRPLYQSGNGCCRGKETGRTKTRRESRHPVSETKIIRADCIYLEEEARERSFFPRKKRAAVETTTHCVHPMAHLVRHRCAHPPKGSYVRGSAFRVLEE